jgi:arsenate reductase-like glutaredoxin family protein
MGLDSRNPPAEAELVRLMLDVPYFIKRPVIRIGGATVFGFDREKVESLIP